jgi:hypothetical protein
MPLEYSTMCLCKCTEIDASKPKYLESYLNSGRPRFAGASLPSRSFFLSEFKRISRDVNGTKAFPKVFENAGCMLVPC